MQRGGDKKKKEKNLSICNPNLRSDPKTNTVFFLNQFLNCELIEEVSFLIQFYDVNILSSHIGYHN